MSIKVDNLFQHADGGYYCLITLDGALKEPADEGVWYTAAIYTGTDRKLRSTTERRWNKRFSPVAEYTGDDESVIRMIRRTNPGSIDFDFLRVFDSWHQTEMAVTGHALELAVASTVVKLAAMMNWNLNDRLDMAEGLSLDITTEDLQNVLQGYEIERVPIENGFRFEMRKSFPNDT